MYTDMRNALQGPLSTIMEIFIQGSNIILPACHMLAAGRRGSCLYIVLWP